MERYVIEMLEHKGTLPIKTARLLLRRYTPEDVPAMFKNYATEEETARYLSWKPYTEIGALYDFVDKCVADYSSPETYHWGIEFEGEIIGGIGLNGVSSRHERCDLGYCIGSRWRNRGIVTEAAGAVVAFAFRELGASKVGAMHDVENPASGRVMEKCGMRREGLLREHNLRKDGKRGDLAVYSILKREWENGLER